MSDIVRDIVSVAVGGIWRDVLDECPATNEAAILDGGLKIVRAEKGTTGGTYDAQTLRFR